MGCGALRHKDLPHNTSRIHIAAVISNAQKDLEEVAELPLRAREEETDLISMVELSVSCSDLPSLSSSQPCAFVAVFKETQG